MLKIHGQATSNDLRSATKVSKDAKVVQDDDSPIPQRCEELGRARRPICDAGLPKSEFRVSKINDTDNRSTHWKPVDLTRLFFDAFVSRGKQQSSVVGVLPFPSRAHPESPSNLQ